MEKPFKFRSAEAESNFYSVNTKDFRIIRREENQREPALYIYYDPETEKKLPPELGTWEDAILRVMLFRHIFHDGPDPAREIEAFLPGGLLIRTEDPSRLEAYEELCNTFFGLKHTRIPGIDMVNDSRSPDTTTTGTQTARRQRNKQVGTDPCLTAFPLTAAERTEADAPERRDGATQVVVPSFSKWTQTTKAAKQEERPAARTNQEGPITRAQSRTAPQTADGSTEVGTDAPWRSEAATQVPRPGSSPTTTQSLARAHQDRDHGRKPDSAATSQEGEEEEGIEVDHYHEEAHSAKQEPPPGRRRPRIRKKKKKKKRPG